MSHIIEVVATEQNKTLYRDLVTLLKSNHNLPPLDMLAVMSQLVGTLILMQDTEKLNAEQAMNFVIKNIEIGNEAGVKVMAAKLMGE